MKKKNGLGMTLFIAITSMVLSFALIVLAKGLQDLTIDGTFEIKQIFNKSVKSPSFWILNITIALAITLFWFWSFQLRKAKRLTEEEYTTKLELYNGTLKFKEKDFIDYIKIENKRRRIEAYKEHMEHKIMRREKWLNRLTIIGITIGRDKRLQAKIDRLNSKITDEYINNHLVWWFYNPVSPNDFRYNALNAGDVADRTASKEGIKVSMTMLRKVIFSLATSTLALSFLTSLLIQFKFSVEFWIILISVILTLAMNYYFGMRFADKIYEVEYLALLDNRIKFMKDYIDWAASTKDKKNTYGEKVIETYIKQKELSTKLEDQIKQAENIKKSSGS